jgi:hypothetical protein
MYKLILSISVLRYSVIPMEILLYSPLDHRFKPWINKDLFNHLFPKIIKMKLINQSYNEYSL